MEGGKGTRRCVTKSPGFGVVCQVQVPEKTPEGLLAGVVVCVGKKLSKMQGELNTIAASLGADFRLVAHSSGLF